MFISNFKGQLLQIGGIIQNAVYVLNGMKCRERQNSSLVKGFHPQPRHQRILIEEIIKIRQSVLIYSEEPFQTVKTMALCSPRSKQELISQGKTMSN